MCSSLSKLRLICRDKCLHGFSFLNPLTQTLTNDFLWLLLLFSSDIHLKLLQLKWQKPKMLRKVLKNRLDKGCLGNAVTSCQTTLLKRGSGSTLYLSSENELIARRSYNTIRTTFIACNCFHYCTNNYVIVFSS